MLFPGNEADRKKTAINLNLQVNDSIDPTEFVFLFCSFYFLTQTVDPANGYLFMVRTAHPAKTYSLNTYSLNP